MKRVIIGALLSTLVVGSLAFSTDSEAQRRRRRGAQQRREQVAPQSEGIAEALGELRWGMTNRQVYDHFVKKVRDNYRERLTKSRDAMEEDRLRHAMNQEIQRIRRSYVRFNGQTTGWDVSFLRDEFTHSNHESMLVIRDGNSQNFYFFINDRLWKWYKAFDSEVFAGQSFDQFASALQGRFGNALARQGRSTERGAEKRWLEWQDGGTRLRAIDENRFYGFYCLVFDEKNTVGRLAELRTNASPRRDGGHALVEAVTQQQETQLENQDIVDRITGRIRRRSQAPEAAAASDASGAATPAATSAMGSSMATVDDDPLSDLDF